MVLDALPDRYRALAAAAAGCGLRQGECFGLRVHDVDFLRGELHVRQQIRLVAGVPSPALPKYRRIRSVPLPEWLGRELAAHIASLEPLPGERTTAPGLGGLLFYGRERKPLNRNYFNSRIWKPALLAAGISPERDAGMHALRHSCASTWLEHGVSIKAVSEYLGHSDPGFTLRVYTHVMPSSADRARNAMDAAFAGRSHADAYGTRAADRG
jgi:integrase